MEKENAGGILFTGYHCVDATMPADCKVAAMDGKLQTDGSCTAKPRKRVECMNRNTAPEMWSNGPEGAARSEQEDPARKTVN